MWNVNEENGQFDRLLICGNSRRRGEGGHAGTLGGQHETMDRIHLDLFALGRAVDVRNCEQMCGKYQGRIGDEDINFSGQGANKALPLEDGD